MIGLGKSNRIINHENKNSLADLIRKMSDKNEKISLLLPWELFNSKKRNTIYC